MRVMSRDMKPDPGHWDGGYENGPFQEHTQFLSHVKNRKVGKNWPFPWR